MNWTAITIVEDGIGIVGCLFVSWLELALLCANHRHLPDGFASQRLDRHHLNDSGHIGKEANCSAVVEEQRYIKSHNGAIHECGCRQKKLHNEFDFHVCCVASEPIFATKSKSRNQGEFVS